MFIIICPKEFEKKYRKFLFYFNQTISASNTLICTFRSFTVEHKLPSVLIINTFFISSVVQ